MNGIVITWPQLMYVSLALILFYAAELLLFLRKSSSSRIDPTIRKMLAEQREHISELQREIENLKVRLVTLHAQHVAGHSLAEAVPADMDAGDESPYSQAIRLAQTGAEAEKVAAECGISRGEADLIVALYRTGTLH